MLVWWYFPFRLTSQTLHLLDQNTKSILQRVQIKGGYEVKDNIAKILQLMCLRNCTWTLAVFLKNLPFISSRPRSLSLLFTHLICILLHYAHTLTSVRAVSAPSQISDSHFIQTWEKHTHTHTHLTLFDLDWGLSGSTRSACFIWKSPSLPLPPLHSKIWLISCSGTLEAASSLCLGVEASWLS